MKAAKISILLLTATSLLSCGAAKPAASLLSASPLPDELTVVPAGTPGSVPITEGVYQFMNTGTVPKNFTNSIMIFMWDDYRLPAGSSFEEGDRRSAQVFAPLLPIFSKVKSRFPELISSAVFLRVRPLHRIRLARVL